MTVSEGDTTMAKVNEDVLSTIVSKCGCGHPFNTHYNARLADEWIDSDIIKGTQVLLAYADDCVLCPCKKFIMPLSSKVLR